MPTPKDLKTLMSTIFRSVKNLKNVNVSQDNFSLAPTRFFFFETFVFQLVKNDGVTKKYLL